MLSKVSEKAFFVATEKTELCLRMESMGRMHIQHSKGRQMHLKAVTLGPVQ